MVGSYGYYCSASPNPSNSKQAYTLYFNYGNVNPAGNSFRCYGCSVRCVKE